MTRLHLGFSCTENGLGGALSYEDGAAKDNDTKSEEHFSISLEQPIRLKNIVDSSSEKNKIDFSLNLMSVIGMSYAACMETRCLNGYEWPFQEGKMGELLIEYFNETLKPEELLARHLLLWRKDNKKIFEGADCLRIVVSLPSTFGMVRKTAIRQAFELSGLIVSKIITNEMSLYEMTLVEQENSISSAIIAFNAFGVLFSNFHRKKNTVTVTKRSVLRSNTLLQTKINAIDYFAEEIRSRFSIEMVAQPRLVEKLIKEVENKLGKDFDKKGIDIELVQLGNKNRKEKPLNYRNKFNAMDLLNVVEKTIHSIASSLASLKSVDLNEGRTLYVFGGTFEQFLIREGIKRSQFRNLRFREANKALLSKGALQVCKNLYRIGSDRLNVELATHPLKIVALIQKKELVTLFEAGQRLPAISRQFVSMSTLNSTALEVDIYEGALVLANDKRLVKNVLIKDLVGDREGEGIVLLSFFLDEAGLFELRASRPLNEKDYLVEELHSHGMDVASMESSKNRLRLLFKGLPF